MSLPFFMKLSQACKLLRVCRVCEPGGCFLIFEHNACKSSRHTATVCVGHYWNDTLWQSFEFHELMWRQPKGKDGGRLFNACGETGLEILPYNIKHMNLHLRFLFFNKTRGFGLLCHFHNGCWSYPCTILNVVAKKRKDNAYEVWRLSVHRRVATLSCTCGIHLAAPLLKPCMLALPGRQCLISWK